MSSTKQIADALGRKEIAARLCVGETAVSNAVVRERFPATWFLTLQAMCGEKGIDCPPRLFGMKGAPQGVDGDSVSQGQAAE